MNGLMRVASYAAVLVLGAVLIVELLAAYGARARRRDLRRWAREHRVRL